MESRTVRVLSVDPGIINFAYAVVDVEFAVETGVIDNIDVREFSTIDLTKWKTAGGACRRDRAVKRVNSFAENVCSEHFPLDVLACERQLPRALELVTEEVALHAWALVAGVEFMGLAAATVDNALGIVPSQGNAQNKQASLSKMEQLGFEEVRARYNHHEAEAILQAIVAAQMHFNKSRNPPS